MTFSFVSSIEYKIACFIVFLVPLWAPLNRWIIGVDAAGRIPLALMLLVLFIYGSRISNVSFKKPLTIYILFAFYLLINGLLKYSYLNYEGNGIYIMSVNLLSPVLYMLIVSFMAYHNFNKTLNWVTWSFVVYCVLCLMFGEMTDSERLGGELNANGMATYADFAYFCLLIQYMRGKRSLMSLLLLSIVPVLLILMSGSRTGFLLFIFVTVLSVLLFYKKGHVGSIVLMVIISIGVYVGFSYVMDNTVLGERLQNSTTQMEGSRLETGTIFDKFGDRGPQYYLSWPYFKKNPIFGIGLMNWRKVSGSPYVFHSEWLVQYCENGLVALILYLVFYISLLRQSWSLSKRLVVQDRKTMRMLIYSLSSVFFLNFVSWTYNSYCVFAIYALSFAFVQKNNCLKVSKKIQ